jgi:iron complex outermembrane recepter protein
LKLEKLIPGFLLATTVPLLIANPSWGQSIQVTEVRLKVTSSGINAILKTNSDIVPQASTSRSGKTLLINILNTRLTLPNNGVFRQDDPVEGIEAIAVTQASPNTLRVAVTGTTEVPAVKLSRDRSGLVLSLSPPPTEAQAPPSPKPKPEQEIEILVTGEQDGYVVPDASTATRTDTPIIDTPQSIQVIPQDVFEDRQIIRVDDALTNVSGITGRLESSENNTNLTIRGFTTNGSTVRNGFRVNSELGTQETANIERIEVIKGPSSVLYGQSEPGGIIGLVTKQPSSNPFYKLELKAGSFGLIRPSIDFSGPLNEDRSLRYRLNVAYQHEDGFRDLEFQTNRFFIAPVLSWDISKRTNLSLVLEYNDEKYPFDLGIPALGNGVVDVPVGRTVNEPDDYITNRSLTLGYDLKHEFSDNWKLNHGFRYVNQDFFVLASLPSFFDESTGDVSLSFADREYHSYDYTMQTNVTGKFKTGSVQHTLLVGVDLNFNRFDEQFTRFDETNQSIVNIFNPVYGSIPRPDLSGIEPSIPFDTEYDRLGVFLQDQITFSDNFILVGSLRYDKGDFRNLGEGTARSDVAWSPRIGLVYKPAPTVSLYANYSRSFTPNFGQTATGELLGPQKGRGFEVGAKTEFSDGKMFATLAYFDITKQNVATTDPDNPFFSVAAGEQRSQGIELDVAGEILPGWNIIANYAYTDARVTEDNNIPVGNRLFNAPYHSGGLWTTYEFQQGNLRGLGFGLGVNYVGSRAGNLANTFEVGDYWLTNLGLFYKRDNWRLGLNVNNLFDVRYISGTSDAREFGNTVGAPFSVIGTLSVEF